MCHIELAGDVLLATHGVKAHDMTFQIESVNQLGHGGDFVGFSIHNELAEGQLVVSRPRADEVQAGAGIRVVETVPQRLAIDGDELAAQRSTDGENKGGEALAKLVRVNRGEDAPEGIVAGESSRQLDPFAQPGLTRFGKALEVIEPLASTDHGC